jgi:hypothetical protein
MRIALTLLFLGTLTAAACGGGSSTPTPVMPAPPAPSTPPSDPPPGPLRTATVRGANGHSASGSARIMKDGNSFVLELGDDFRIDSGNNDVMLTRQPDTRTGADLNLGNMQSLTGRQRYTLPDDAAGYGYVMLWCRPFRVPIGVGELR